MISAQQLDALDSQTGQMMLSLMAQIRANDALIAQHDQEAAFKQALIDKLTHEMGLLKRLKFAATSERFASTLGARAEEPAGGDPGGRSGRTRAGA